jgi:hypothetical protein
MVHHKDAPLVALRPAHTLIRYFCSI